MPLPAAAWLFLSGLAGVGALARRRRAVTPEQESALCAHS
ncbi:MAG: VPLPA-CTERM sorting domain-containing protein [Pseudomonadota bacterium]